MKLNRKWLHEEFVDLSHISDKDYVEKLTVFGQKVETYERMDAEIKNVKVGKDARVGEDRESASDIAVVGADVVVAAGTVVPAGAMISEKI